MIGINDSAVWCSPLLRDPSLRVKGEIPFNSTIGNKYKTPSRPSQGGGGTLNKICGQSDQNPIGRWPMNNRYKIVDDQSYKQKTIIYIYIIIISNINTYEYFIAVKGSSKIHGKLYKS